MADSPARPRPKEAFAVKRLILTLAAAAAVAAPLAIATDASAQPRRHDRYESYRGPGRGYYGGGYYAPPPRVYYAPPPRPYYSGYAWRRGGYLPQGYPGYYVSDYGRYGLRPPPRGYRWYRNGNDYVMAAIATGLIFDIVTR
jgi:Ni/Co efflux regulator RcnB